MQIKFTQKLNSVVSTKEALGVVFGTVLLCALYVGVTQQSVFPGAFQVAAVKNATEHPDAVLPASTSNMENRILVKYKNSVSDSRRSGVAEKHLLRSRGAIKQLDVEIYEVSADDTSDEVVGRMRAFDKDVIEFVEKDEIVAPQFTPNDTSFSAQWDKVRTGADLAWDVTTGNSAVVVGVADTGVDCTHPDLSANCVPGWNFYDNNSDARDVYGHGTPVAGVIAAVGNNGTGVAGTAWNVKIMPLRISGTDGYASWSAIASAITYAADRGVKVVNNSYMSSQSATIQNAAQYLWNKGGIFVDSAGNTGVNNGATTNSQYIITVSGTDINDNKYSWSSFGRDVDVSAPGCTGASTANGGGYRSFCGTSNASPEVAGTLALIYSVKPSLTPSQVANFLFTSARDYAEVGWDMVYGWGRIDTLGAVVLARDSQNIVDTTPPSTPSTLTASSIESNRVALSWGVSTDNLGVLGYQVWRDGIMLNKTANVSYTDTSASPLFTYTYNVIAYDEAGNVSSSSPVLVVQTPEAPLALVGNTVLSKTKSSAMISWSTNMSSTGFVRYSKSSSGLTLNSVDKTTGTTHATALAGLTPKTTYYYQIVATKPDGTGTTTSAIATFRTTNR